MVLQRMRLTVLLSIAAAGIAVVVILALVWVELAVGIFGTPWAGS